MDFATWSTGSPSGKPPGSSGFPGKKDNTRYKQNWGQCYENSVNKFNTNSKQWPLSGFQQQLQNLQQENKHSTEATQSL